MIHTIVPLKQEVSLAYANNFGVAKSWVSKGYEPVECAYGRAGSVVGKYVLDHHSSYFKEPPVSIKAAELTNAGVRLSKFLTAGMPDPDACYAILVLSGNIEPNLDIATAIAELDVDPIGIDRTQQPYLRNAVFEMLLGVPQRSINGYVAALGAGIKAYNPQEIDQNLLERALEYEQARLSHATSEIRLVEGDFALVVSDGLLDTAHFQTAPCIVQYKPGAQKITIRGCSPQAAQRLGIRSVYDLFGPPGLDKVYGELDPIVGPGSGGRPDVGGSPQHLLVSEEQARRVLNLLKEIAN